MTTRLRFVLVVLFLLPPLLFAEPRAVTPRHYDLTLVPDLQAGTFEGTVAIDTVAAQPVREVVLDAAGLTIDEASLGGRNAEAVVDAARQTLTLRVTEAVPAGAVTVRVRYHGTLGKEPHGLYVVDANGKRFLATRFQQAHAREAFPSFDEPEFSATFAMSVVAAPGQTAISNGAVVADVADDRGLRTVRFGTTPPMQTHAVVLVLGDFDCVSDRAGDVPVRVCAAPGQLPRARFALEATKHLLPFYAAHFGAPYPFAKLDQVVLPGLPAGAEESGGAVLYRERALLIDDDGAPEMKKAIAGIIAHELSHMWGGGIRAWDEFWLYEGTADWLAAKAIAAWKPEWWTATDAVTEGRRAMAADLLQTTRAIAPENASSEKTPALLRMIEEYAPFEMQRAALRTANRHGATTGDGKTILDSFAAQAGVPLVSVSTRCENGRTQLTLTQERLTTDSTPSTQLWTIPVCYRNATTNGCALLTKKTEMFTVEGCSPLVANREGRGYYVTSYERDDLPVAGLSPAERLTVLHDAWALMRAGRRGADDFLLLADRFRGERDGAVMTRLVTALDSISHFIHDEAALTRYRAWVGDFLRPMVRELGWSDAETPGCGCGALRPMVLYASGFTGRDPQTLARANELAFAWLDDPSAIDPPLVRNVLALAAASGDARLYERFHERLVKGSSPADETALLTRTITRFRAPAQLRQTFDWILSPAVSPQDAARLIGGLLAERESQAYAWTLLQEQWSRVVEKVTPGNAGQLISATRSFCDPVLRDGVRRFFAAHPMPGHDRELAESLEIMGQCTAIIAAQESRVATWLERRDGPAAASAR